MPERFVVVFCAVTTPVSLPLYLSRLLIFLNACTLFALGGTEIWAERLQHRDDLGAAHPLVGAITPHDDVHKEILLLGRHQSRLASTRLGASLARLHLRPGNKRGVLSSLGARDIGHDLLGKG